jgi:hypothetical protein
LHSAFDEPGGAAEDESGLGDTDEGLGEGLDEPGPAAGEGVPMLRSFAEVVDYAGTRREAKLKVHLEEHVSLVKFDPAGSIELHLLAGAPKELGNELREKLNAWTGGRWMVALSKAPGERPIGEVARERAAAEVRDLEKHPAVAAVLRQFPDAEIDKLADPSVRAMFVVNPSNPPSVMLAPATLARIEESVTRHNPDLIVVTDDVYGTFVPGFVSLMDVLPTNTIAVYSFSKYFGATGWRLGVVAIHENNVLDRRLRAMSTDELEELDRRYESISTTTADIPFIDRMVADSRQVALNHTAGLSLPQQVQMTLFAAF